MKPLGTLILIVNHGIGFNKERKLGWMNKIIEGNSEIVDIEAKEGAAHWLKNCRESEIESEPYRLSFFTRDCWWLWQELL